MTDRIFAFTVTLEKPTREDDVEATVAAISMIKGVAKVVPLVADAETYFAVETARHELGRQLWAVLYPKTEGR